MLLSHSRPSPLTWALVGTGAAFLTPSSRLSNGRPGSFCRIQWLSGAQTTSSILYLRATYAEPELYGVMRLAGLIGTTLPVGTKIVAKRKIDLSWSNAVEARVIERSDGVRVAWFYWEPYDDDVFFSGFEFEIYNDVFGAASIEADSNFEIGEAWGGDLADWRIRPSLSDDLEEFSKVRKTLNGQPYTITRRAGRIYHVECTPVLFEDSHVSVKSFKAVRQRIQGYRPCVVVPITGEPFTGSPVDLDYVNEHADFGYAETIGPIVGDAPRFVFSARFNAPPAHWPYGPGPFD